MNSYETLLIEAEKHDYIVKELPLNDGYKGRIKGKRIAIEQSLTTAEKTCVLAEELAHGDITVGNILDQSNVQNRRQEQKARMLSFTRRAGLYRLADTLRAGYRSSSEIAEYMEVTEEFLIAAIEGYRRKYGTYVKVENDVLMLEPTIGLLSQIQ